MPGQKFGPAWFPGLIAVGLMICGALLIVYGLRGAQRTQPWFALPEWIRRPRPLASVTAVLGGLLFYVFAADWLGFYLPRILLLTLWSRLLGASWPMAVSARVGATLLIHLSFFQLLRHPPPRGVFAPFAIYRLAT